VEVFFILKGQAGEVNIFDLDQAGRITPPCAFQVNHYFFGGFSCFSVPIFKYKIL